MNSAIARKERAQIREQIANSKLSIFSAITDPRESIQRMRVVDLLSSVPGIGNSRAIAILERCEISLTRKIGGLGKHQIRALRNEPTLHKVEPPIGRLIVISGPGGVGKSTIAAALRRDPRFWVSVSATTRPPRAGEREGIDYFFISNGEFDEMIQESAFLEWAEFAGARYGTPKSGVQEGRELGKHVLLEIEIDGARQVAIADSSALLVFIAPPSWEELEQRLMARGTDSPERRAARLALAKAELAAAADFQHILINTQVDEVIKELVSLATSPQGGQTTPRS
jgi:guanylate kinase